jgi:hypothetical protein
MWGGGFPAKRAMAADKLQEPAQESWREFASDYERGFIDGMQKQAQSSVDKAVNMMAQPAQEQEEDWGVIAEKQLASIKRDTRASFEDAMVRATHKVMAELEAQPAYPAGPCDCGVMNDRQRLEAIVSVINKYLPPFGMHIMDAMSAIISLVDPLPAQSAQEPVARVLQIIKELRPAIKPMEGMGKGKTTDEWFDILVKEIERIQPAQQEAIYGMNQDDWKDVVAAIAKVRDGRGIYLGCRPADVFQDWFLALGTAKVKEKNNGL